MPSDAKSRSDAVPRSWLFLFEERSRRKREADGGLGSSHTTPCGAAVPARPPTRSSETTHLYCEPQWVARATGRGTRVVVQRGYLWPKPKLLPHGKMLIINKMRDNTHRLLGSALPIVLIQFRSNLIQLFAAYLAPVQFANGPYHSSRLSSGHVPAGVCGYS